MRSFNRPYLPEVDHLRGCAMMLIVLYHGLHLIGTKISTGLQYSEASPWPQPSNLIWLLITEGHSAVSLFIVLSGFILSHGMLERQPNYRRYLVARVLRIYPMLLLCLAMAFLVSGADLPTILASLLPLDTRANVASPFTSMFWAVKVEMQCYLLFPALLWGLRTYGIGVPLAVVTLCLALRLLAVFGADASPRDLSYWTLAGRLDQFAIGMVCAWLYAKGPASALSPWLFPIALAAAFAMLFVFNRLGGWPADDIWRVAFPPLEAAVWSGVILTYLSFGRLLPMVLTRPLVALGVVSYSAYLLHPVLINIVVTQRWWIAPTGIHQWDALITVGLLVLPILLLLATLTFRLIEAPTMALRPRYASEERHGGSAMPKVPETE